MIYILYPRVSRLKTIPFTAAHTYIVHIWQYPPPRIKHGIRHFVQMLRRGEPGTIALIGQTQQISLCLCCVSFSHDASERTYNCKHKEKEKVWSLCLCLRQPHFHGEISALMLAFVLASLMKTRLMGYPYGKKTVEQVRYMPRTNFVFYSLQGSTWN